MEVSERNNINYWICSLHFTIFSDILFFSQANLARAREIAARFTPLGGRILLRKLDPVTMTAGGIALPESAQARQNGAVVLRVPEDDSFDAVKVDDTVLLSEYGGQNFEIDGEKFILATESDLLGKIRDK